MRLKGANQLLIVLKVLVVYHEKSFIDKGIVGINCKKLKPCMFMYQVAHM